MLCPEKTASLYCFRRCMFGTIAGGPLTVVSEVKGREIQREHPDRLVALLLHFSCVLIDNWYFCKIRTRHIEQLGKDWVAESKTNRLVTFQKRWFALKRFAQTLIQETKCRVVQTWGYHLYEKSNYDTDERYGNRTPSCFIEHSWELWCLCLPQIRSGWNCHDRMIFQTVGHQGIALRRQREIRGRGTVSCYGVMNRSASICPWNVVSGHPLRNRLFAFTCVCQADKTGSLSDSWNETSLDSCWACRSMYLICTKNRETWR